ncbi:unnamed protein product [Protopolystoma xenopodis]|uniref:Uncharacterized protein n=1 Tax=Protopolystoma xenopodis TaxID=117903 RepID=A0A448XPW2_9PLAT|nr:unnamed protein product [Protopolystoma xenopodis]
MASAPKCAESLRWPALDLGSSGTRVPLLSQSDSQANARSYWTAFSRRLFTSSASTRRIFICIRNGFCMSQQTLMSCLRMQLDSPWLPWPASSCPCSSFQREGARN